MGSFGAGATLCHQHRPYPLALPPATLTPSIHPPKSTRYLSDHSNTRPDTSPDPAYLPATWGCSRYHTWCRGTVRYKGTQYVHTIIPGPALGPSPPALTVPVCPQPSPSHPILPQHATRLAVEDSTTPVISLFFAGARLANSNLRPPVVALTRGHPGRARVSSGPGQVYTSSVFSLIYLDLPITSYPPSTSSSLLTTARVFLENSSHPPLPLQHPLAHSPALELAVLRNCLREDTIELPGQR